MDILLRFLIGIPLFIIVGGISFFLFNLLTGLVNFLALGAAKLLRTILRFRGSSLTLGGIAATIADIGKTLSLVAFWISVAWYSFVYPTAGSVAETTAAAAAAFAFLIWTPGVFVTFLFLETEDI